MAQLFGSSSKKDTNVESVKSLEDSANIISRYLMTYLNPVFRKGYTENFVHEDLGPVSEQDKADLLYEEFLRNWKVEQKKPKKSRSLWIVLWKTSGILRALWGIFLYGAYTAISFGPVEILNVLTQYFQGTRELTQAQLGIVVAMLFVMPMLGSICSAQSNVIMAHIGLQFRNALITMIYRKALKLSPAARQSSSTGQIVNMFSNDTAQLQRFLFFMNNVVIAPFQIAVSIVLIYLQVGVSTFVGLALLLILIPVNGIIFNMVGFYRTRKVKVTDVRVKLMNEVLSGIRVIKNYAWEVAFEKKVTEIRARELAILKQLAYIIAIGFTIALMAAPTIQPVLIFYTYVRLGNQLDAAKIFTTIALFNLMQLPFAFLPLGLSQYSQSLVSSKRMLDFFDADELEPYIDHSPEKENTDGYSIKMENVFANWVKDKETDETTTSKKKGDKIISKQLAEKEAVAKDSDAMIRTMVAGKRMLSVTLPSKRGFASLANDDKEEREGEGEQNQVDVEANHTEETPINRALNTLIDISISVKKGQLVAVVGSVGSGKSSLLSALLGELHLHSGYVRVVGSVAYCDQKPWILNATVKDNILFGRPYDEMKFDQAIHAASMEDDIRVLPGGILTEIGERGINLSGGQKARVALARAVYCNADVYFLDDPLSAVDAHVGQHIFQECIKKTLGDKTRILVTHHVHLLQQCDSIIVLEDGKVKVSGTYDEISNSGIDIHSIIPHAVAELSTITEAVEEEEDEEEHEKEKDIKEKRLDELKSYRVRKMSEAEYDSLVEAEIQHRNSITKDNTNNKEDMGREEQEEDKSEDRSGVNIEKVLSNEEIVVSVPVPIDSSPRMSTERKRSVSGASVNGVSTGGGSDKGVGNALTQKSSKTSNKSSAKVSSKSSVKAKADHRKADTRSSNLMTIEEKKLGDVGLETYSYYIRAGGIYKFSALIIILMGGQAIQLGSSFWLQYWANVSLRDEIEGNPLSEQRNIYFLNIYAVLACGYLICYLIRSVILAEHRLGTSVGLHINLLKRILGAPVAFFDITPLGRILNRFSSDMLTVDEELSQSISQVTNSVFSCIGALGAIAAATKGTFMILIVPLIYFYNYIQKFFRKTNTTVARMESISRSPIYADFSQALTGLVSIRAYHEEDRFIRHLEGMIDRNSIANITSQNASQWLAIRLDFLGSIITFFIALLAATTPKGFIPAGYMALGLSYSFQLTTFLKFAVRMIATFEAQMNSVERIMYYIDNVEQEGSNKEVSPESIPKDWPSEGAIVGKNLQMRYRDGPLVLKGVSFDIKGHEKIGIAGRTGSGKSSMMIALFRIQELAEGSILIDGIDIATVPLHILRSRLGIIPQDPVMFSATIRFNLDPFNEHTDQDLWSVLESVNMKDHVTSLPNKLVEEVAEGGDNFSAGQRQLICIARALLRHPKILVLDEATASIDNDTDALVQVMVREQFKSSTVLTIAHRLHTIIDSDKIMVLDSGNLAEFDSAENLLAKENGLFKLLWNRHQADHKE